MKKFFKFALVGVLSVVLFSCSTDEFQSNNLELEYLTKEERIQNLDNLSSLYADFSKTTMNDLAHPDNEFLTKKIVNESKSILNNIGFKENDFSDFSEDELDMFYAAFGGALVLIHDSELNGGNIEANSFGDNAWPCFKEAIGVDAIAAIAEISYELYAGEVAAGWAVDSAAAGAFRQASYKAIKKLATRYLGFVGAAIVIADFILCMNR